MKKTFVRILPLLLLAVLLASGCREERETQQADPENGLYQIWYTGTGYKLVTAVRQVSGTKSEELAGGLIEMMRHPAADFEGASAIPQGVNVTSLTEESGTMAVSFDSGYTEMTPARELLCRAALVRTVTQIPGILRVAIYVDGQRLTDAAGHPIGPFTEEDFINVSGLDINISTQSPVTVYFAASDGSGLLGTTQRVTYSGLASVGEYVMDQLMEGPPYEALPVIADGTQVLDLTVSNGVCYLNLSPGPSLPEGVTAELSLYAMVNSLTTVTNITSVQILIDSSSDEEYFGISVKEPFTQNLDLILS